MEAQLDRRATEGDNYTEVKKVDIVVDGSRFTISPSITGGIEIMKTNLNGSAIAVYPRVTNLIDIK